MFDLLLLALLLFRIVCSLFRRIYFVRVGSGSKGEHAGREGEGGGRTGRGVPGREGRVEGRLVVDAVKAAHVVGEEVVCGGFRNGLDGMEPSLGW